MLQPTPSPRIPKHYPHAYKLFRGVITERHIALPRLTDEDERRNMCFTGEAHQAPRQASRCVYEGINSRRHNKQPVTRPAD